MQEMKRDSQQALEGSVLSTQHGERVFMQAANQVRDIVAHDNLREASDLNPNFLTAAGNFHHENGFAPQFEVARSFMRDLRFASEHLSAAPGYEFLPTPVPSTTATHSDNQPSVLFDSNASRQAWQASLDRANELKAAAAPSSMLQQGVAQQSMQRSTTVLTGDRSSTASAKPATSQPATQASVMAKLQLLQQRLAEASWQPGQPLPASIGDPTRMFQGELHLLPPQLASMLQALLSQGQSPAAPAAEPSAATSMMIEQDDGDDATWED